MAVYRAAVPQGGKKRQREAHQLPAGRHGLPRSFVVNNQRERILSAVADVTSAAGYVDMSVEDICVTAGVSRRTFYDHYSDKRAAFLAAYDAVSAQLVEKVRNAFESADGFADGVYECLDAFLQFVASEPAFADMCIVEVMAAGPEAVERRKDAMQAFAALIQRGVDDQLPKRGRPPELVAETIVGGIYEVVYARIVQGRTAELPELLPDLMFSLLLPYVGHEAAKAEYRKAQRRLRRQDRPAPSRV
jgi:AcrR family transcriptional regulator